MQHFRNFFHPHGLAQKLSKDAKILLITFLVWQAVSPIFAAFSHAFLWRNTQSLVSVITYTLGFFIMLPLGYFIVGHVIRHISLKHIYGMSMTLQSLVLLMLMYFAPTTPLAIFALGLLYGITASFYWSSRNLLELELTTDKNRNYFYGTTISLRSIINVVAPVLIGWLIIDSPLRAVTSIQGVYVILAIIALAVSMLLYGITQKLSYDIKRNVPMHVKNPSQSWRYARMFTLLDGLATGRHFYIPALIVLYLVGNEEILGIFEAISAVVLSVVIYTIGRYMPSHKRVYWMGFGMVLYTVVSIVFSVSFDATGTVLYRTVYPMALALLWITVVPIRLEIIEKVSKSKNMHFAYLTDNEIYLNIGRIGGVGVFFWMAHTYGEAQALQFVPAIVSIAFVGAYYYGYKAVESVEK